MSRVEEMDDLDKQIWFQHDEAECLRAKGYKSLAEVHDQLESWLKELKAYREAHEAIESMKPSWVHTDGVKLCLSVLKERLEGKDGKDISDSH